MQSVEISGLKEIQKKLEGYPEAMKKARSEFFEEAGREMLSTVRRRIGGQGYVANVQEVYTGSGDGYPDGLHQPPERCVRLRCAGGRNDRGRLQCTGGLHL